MFGGNPSADFQSDAGLGLTEIFHASSEFNGTPAKFEPVADIDTVPSNGGMVNVNVKLVCITGMSAYEDKSLEELRAEDYKRGKVHVYRNPLHPDVTQGVLLDPKLLAATTSSTLGVPGDSFEVPASSNSFTTVQPWSQKPVLLFGTSPSPAMASSLKDLTSGAESSVESLVPATTASPQPFTGGFSFKSAGSSEPSVTARTTIKATGFSGFNFGKALQSESAKTIDATPATSTSNSFSLASNIFSASSPAPATVSTFTFAPPLTSSGTTGAFAASTSSALPISFPLLGSTSPKHNVKLMSTDTQVKSVESAHDARKTKKSRSVFDLGFNTIRRTVGTFWKGNGESPEDAEMEQGSALTSTDDSSGVKLADMFQLLKVMNETQCNTDDVVKLVRLAKTMKEAAITANDLANLKYYYKAPS